MASSSSRPSWKYDVFLSFRGEDTRKGFISHLFNALEKDSIVVFKDDRELEKGEAIAPELLKAIEESKCSIVVLSKTYAFSTWCLDELSQIVACKKRGGHKVYPVFYDVDPSDVRKQKGTFHEAFAKHEETFKDDIERIRKWRHALEEAANLSGWHISDCYEADIIEVIMKEISIKLSAEYTSAVDNLVAIDRQLDELKKKMCLESKDVRFIGISGMGGIGKTTLARVAYDYASLSAQFDGKSFLANVREQSAKRGLVSLQQQLLSQTLKKKPSDFQLWSDQDGADMIRKRLCRRKVLVVIDDIDDIDQLMYLAGNVDWFGLGSKIIITSRDQHLLKRCGVHKENIHNLTPLNYEESLQLLSSHAFKSYEAPNTFQKLCNHVVRYCEGLPLALKVIGSFLYDRDATEWESTLRRLKMDFDDKIFNVLRISFNGLQEREKKIFLDIACFFRGHGVDFVKDILDGCGFEPSIGISVLIEKCLLTCHGEQLWMHDLLQEMGRKLVRQESPDEPGKRSRLWLEEDIRHVLTKNTGTEVIEGIICEEMIRQEIQVHADAFSRMTRLRGYPFKYLPSSFKPDELIQINMPSSNIVELWNETKHPRKLTSINLSNSQNLIKTPNVEGALNLKFISFGGCPSLFGLDPSIGSVKSLRVLNLMGCKNLKSLPENLGALIFLKKLNACCTGIKTVPSMSGLENLRQLNLNFCERLEEIHSSLRTLPRLEDLSLLECRSLKSLPSTVKGLTSLRQLCLNGCSLLENLPEDLGELEHLKKLMLAGTAICQLPSSFRCLTNLKELILDTCGLSETDISHVAYLKSLKILYLRNLNIESLPQLPSLELLIISNCKRFKSLSALSSLTSLVELALTDCNLSNEVINSCDFSLLPSLSRLDLSNDLRLQSLPESLHLAPSGNFNVKRRKGLMSLPRQSESAILDDFLGPRSPLDLLNSSWNKFDSLPHLSSIYKLDLIDCKCLRSIPKLPSSVKLLSASGCISLEIMPDTLPQALNLAECTKLKLNQGCNSVILPLLQKHFQEPSRSSQRFWFLAPGSGMPKWFDHQREGNGISIQVPPNLFNADTHCKGFIICFELLWHLYTNFSIDILVNGKPVTLYISSQCTGRFKLNHHFILFLPFSPPHSFNSWVDTGYDYESRQFMKDWRSAVDENFSNFGFRVKDSGSSRCRLTIKKSGIRIVYEQDVEELIQLSTSQHHNLWCHNNCDHSAAESSTGDRNTRKRKWDWLSGMMCD